MLGNIPTSSWKKRVVHMQNWSVAQCLFLFQTPKKHIQKVGKEQITTYLKEAKIELALHLYEWSVIWFIIIFAYVTQLYYETRWCVCKHPIGLDHITCEQLTQNVMNCFHQNEKLLMGLFSQNSTRSKDLRFKKINKNMRKTRFFWIFLPSQHQRCAVWRV